MPRLGTSARSKWMILYGLSIPATAGAETIVVGPGASIQAAIDGATDGDTILIEPGTYVVAIDLLGKALIVESQGGPEVTTIDGAGAGPVVQGAPTGAMLSGFTITGGNALTGGALVVVGSSPTISACIIGANQASEGGAIHVSDGAAPRFLDCVFTANVATASHGGAIFVSDGAPEIRRCTFIGNESEQRSGGAIFGSASSPVIDACTFDANSAHLSGGAIRSVSGGAPEISACLFADNGAGQDGGAISNDASGSAIVGCSFSWNHAPLGGAIYAAQGAPQIANSLFLSNDAEYGGGVMIALGADAEIANCTFFGNSASVSGGTTDSGGGIRIVQSAPSITNSILWGNGPDQVSEEKSSTYLSHCDVQGGWDGAGTGNFSDDPLFVDPLSGDFSLEPRSPCVDAGDSGALPLDVVDLDEDGDLDEQLPLDLAGNVRIAGDAVDLGPIENMPEACPTDIDDDGETGFADLTALLMGWGACPLSGACAGDLDGSDTVGFADLTSLLMAWGACPDSKLCPGDIDDSGTVGFSDLTALVMAWGACPPDESCPADLGGDGNVGFADLSVLLANWGGCGS